MALLNNESLTIITRQRLLAVPEGVRTSKPWLGAGVGRCRKGRRVAGPGSHRRGPHQGLGSPHLAFASIFSGWANVVYGMCAVLNVGSRQASGFFLLPFCCCRFPLFTRWKLLLWVESW